MPRKTHHQHAVIGRTVEFRPYTYSGSAGGYVTGDSVCGESSGSPKDTTAEAVAEYNRKATCPKCAQKWGKAKLAKLAGRVALEPHDFGKAGYRYRSAWRLIVDGVHRGYIVNESGWGKGWDIKQLPENPNGHYPWGPELGAYDTPQRYSTGERMHGLFPIHGAARDAAAAAAVDLVAAGHLPTAEERAAVKAEREARRAELDRRQAEERRQRMEERTLAREALASIRDRAERGEIALTNSEAAGLSLAIGMI